MSESTLIEFTNARRFLPSRHRCPQCGGATLEEHFPPSYGGGTYSTTRSEWDSSQKLVCLACRIHFVRYEYHRRETGAADIDDVRMMNIVPLVERDGKLLTPHDVRCYAYYDKHGVFPVSEYG